MIINNVELQNLDIFDADIAEKYENMLEKVVKEAKATEELKTSEAIRKQCSLVFECFNYLFGEGTDKKVFGEKANLIICLKAFEELVESVNEQKQEVEKITSKYSPSRAQRRAK
jgi:hypothetical protein